MELFSESARRDPYPLYAQLRATMPVVRLEAQRMWVVFRYDTVKRVLHDSERFSSNVGPTRGEKMDWLLFMDPPRHTELRGLVNRAFTSRSIAALEPRIRELSRGLLDAAGDEFDLVGAYATPLPMMVIAEMIGLPASEWRTYARWSEAIVGLGNTISGDGAERAVAAFDAANREMCAMLDGVAPTGDTLLARLVDAGLPHDEIVRFVQLLLAAGTETTTNTISNAMLALAAHPEQLPAARADIPRTIEEVLRWRSPVQAMFRATRTAVELDGVAIPAGEFLVVAIGSANRDERQFAEAERFDVTRDHRPSGNQHSPTPHLAFGHGIHFCLGAPLARLEVRIALADLLAHDWDVPAEWAPRGSFHVHGPRELIVRRRR